MEEKKKNILKLKETSNFKIEISKVLTELVLEPIGGSWKNNEVLAFGDEKTKDLQKEGTKAFEELFFFNKD